MRTRRNSARGRPEPGKPLVAEARGVRVMATSFTGLGSLELIVGDARPGLRLVRGGKT